MGEWLVEDPNALKKKHGRTNRAMGRVDGGSFRNKKKRSTMRLLQHILKQDGRYSPTQWKSVAEALLENPPSSGVVKQKRAIR